MADIDAQQAAPVTFDVTRQEDQRATLLRVGGELDLSNVARVRAAVDEVVARNPDKLVIDAGGLTFADSSAIALMVSWAKLVKELEIREPPPLLRAVIESMGLAQVLHIRP